MLHFGRMYECCSVHCVRCVYACFVCRNLSHTFLAPSRSCWYYNASWQLFPFSLQFFSFLLVLPSFILHNTSLHIFILHDYFYWFFFFPCLFLCHFPTLLLCLSVSFFFLYITILCLLFFQFVLSHLWAVKNLKNELISDEYLIHKGAAYSWQFPKA